MFKNNSKRKRLSDLLIPGIIFAVIGAVFAFQGIRDYNNLNGDLLNLNTASVSDLADGKYVEINVEYANYIHSVKMSKLPITYSKELQNNII